MTIRNLHHALMPTSVAVVGASRRPGSVGEVVLHNIIAGGFAGAIYPVNPKYDSVAGLPCYARAKDLPEAPDLAVIITPPQTVPRLIGEFGERGTRVAVVITAGIGNKDGLRQRMLDAARPHLLRVIGPNTIGILSPRAALNASFVHITAPRGRLGLISQSGAMVSSIVDWGAATGIGFSQLFSLGDMADVDVGDALDLLAEDDATSAILIYLESIPHPRKFMSAARAAARLKPVIAVKPGRHAEAAQAARTHTGALAGADRVVEAALRRAGIIRVLDLDDLFNAAAITARYAPMARGRIGIVTNGGGAGVLAVDLLLDQGGELAELGPETVEALNRVLPPIWSHANPVDIIGDAPPERYAAAIEAVAADANIDALLVMNCPTALCLPSPAAQAVAGKVERGHIAGKPLLACWLGKAAAEPARKLLEAAGIASFDTPTGAAEAISLLTRWASLRRALERVPASAGQIATDSAVIDRVLRTAAAEGRSVLTEGEAKAVVGACGVPVPKLVVARTEREVIAAAADLLQTSTAVVVKLLSKTISHKSDVGGVVLDLEDAEAAAAAARDIARRLAEHIPGAVPDGFSVQPMIRRPRAHELIAGIGNDAIFGPTLLFGAGGTAVEIVDDVATGLAPLDAVLAGDLIDHTRISRLLAGYRDRPPADRDAIIRVLLGLSQLVVDYPAILSVDINPLLADADGVIALDARIEIDPALVGQPGPNPRLAIRPYPTGLATRVTRAGADFLIRPIMPTDAALYPAFLARVSAEDMRRRFFTALKTLSPEMLVRLTQLDYDRDLAFVALEAASGALAGVARYASDPDHEDAEFGVMVRTDLQGRGLGAALMQWLVRTARAEGLKRIHGLILAENVQMLELCRELSFVLDRQDTDPSVIRARLDLSNPARASTV
jgi:acetyltransferase